MRTLNLIAEALGFLSGILLLIPALSLNGVLRDVQSTSTTFKNALTTFGKRVGEAADNTMKDARIPSWSAGDQAMLVAGAIFLAISFVIKFYVVWNSP